MDKKRSAFRRKINPLNKAWKVIDIWKGGTCVILGGGPSLNDVDLSLFHKFRVIGVNNAYGTPIKNKKGDKTLCYKPHPWVDICWFGDERWYRWHRKWLRKYPGLLCCCKEKMHGKDGIFGVCRGKPQGIDIRPRFVAWNKSSGASAINFAYHLGVKRIILLGFDMRRVDDSPNWHDDHPAPLKNPYVRFLKPFPIIAKEAKELGLEIINATPGSALECFPIMTPQEVLDYCRTHKGKKDD